MMPVPALALSFIAPFAVLVAALVAAMAPASPYRTARFAEAAAIVAMIAATVFAVMFAVDGVATLVLFDTQGYGLSVRRDIVSVTMALLVSFIGWIVVRYAATYLDREPRHGVFTAWLCAVLGAVMLLVTAGNLVQLVLAWIATSVALHQLLLFYPDRVAAQRAARKKFVTARASDAALIAAAVLLGMTYGTGDIATILREAHSDIPTMVAAACLAVAALLKSAQFPTHGWLTEVMETPTPVSALLHAGVVNAGGFVLIRFADVMLTSHAVLAVLVIVGGFTALFGSLVMLTQSAVKTSLAWSTVAQMGFMIMQCGLALFPIALLHIVAHSLYKAHSFLAAGGAVERITSYRRPGAVAVPGAAAVGRAFLIALGIYALVAVGFDFADKQPQAVALGAILIFGSAYLIAQGLADAAPAALTRRTAAAAVAASLAYFVLHAGADWLTAGTLPLAPAPGPLEWALIVLAVTSFGVIAVVQSLFPLWAGHPAAAGLRVHLSNGLYVNAAFDRLLGGWTVRA